MISMINKKYVVITLSVLNLMLLGCADDLTGTWQGDDGRSQIEPLDTSHAIGLSDLNEMQLYENTENDFKMSYPSNWIAQEPDPNDQGVVVGFLAPGEDVNNAAIYLFVQIEKLPSGQKITLGQYGEAVQRSLKAVIPDLKILTEGNVSIDGQPGYAIVYNLGRGDITYRVFKAWTLHGENAYGFTYNAPEDRYGLFAEDVRKMIVSLKFDTATGLESQNQKFQNSKNLAQNTGEDTYYEPIEQQTADLIYRGYITFSNNRGESIDDAISIYNAKTDSEGVVSEYYYLEWRFGERGVDWELDQQFLLQEEDRFYDRMDINFSDGKETTIYFDITDFFGKL